MRPVSHALFDAHLHVIDPRFPLVANDGYLPPAFDAEAYRERTSALQVVGGTVVAGSFQGFDTSWIAPSLAALGAGFVAVTNLPVDAPDEEIERLDRIGVRAVRVNLFRGGSAGLGDLDVIARKVHEVAGWHTELYLDATDLAELEPRLATLPQVSIDHLGMRPDPSGALLRLVAAGAVVKATGLGRIEIDDPSVLVRAILDANPHGLVVGTDLPSTRARRPFADADLATVEGWLEPHEVEAVFVDNARRLYRLDGHS